MATDSQPQTFYAGQFRHAIDEKNRLTIPSRWRRGEAQEFIVVPDPKQQFLAVMLPEEFARMITEAEASTQLSAPERRSFLRQLHARSQHGSADKQGRIVLPEDLCKQLGLKGEVALVGGRGRFEIWNLDNWKRAHEAETATYQRVADAIGL
jgi:MraZ protein